MTAQTTPMPPSIYLSPSNTTITHSPTPSPDTAFIDHYAVMNLDTWATSTEITASFRQLRGTYFTTDAIKYRALQAAFAVLSDREARGSYDRVWRERRGLLAPSSLGLQKQKVGIVRERVGVLERKDSKEVLDFGVGEGAGDVDVKEETAVVVTVEPEEEVEIEEEEVVGVREPLIGSRVYQSYVPILDVYEGRRVHPLLKCARPKYVLDIARKAVP